MTLAEIAEGQLRLAEARHRHAIQIRGKDRAPAHLLLDVLLKGDLMRTLGCQQHCRGWTTALTRPAALLDITDQVPGVTVVNHKLNMRWVDAGANGRSVHHEA